MYIATFTCAGFASETFLVSQWEAKEEVSQLYVVDITLATECKNLEVDTIINAAATFSLHDGKNMDKTKCYHGIVTEVDQMDSDSYYAYYRVVIQPRFAQLARYSYSDVYLDKTLPELIRIVMRACGLGVEAVCGSGVGDCDFRIAMPHAEAEATRNNFVFQCDESCLDFLTRRLARDGVYYYFEQSKRDVVVFCSGLSQQQTDKTITLKYRPPQTRMAEHDVMSVSSFCCKTGSVAKDVVLRSFAASHAALDLDITEPVCLSSAVGSQAFLNEHFDTIRDGQRLARLRAEEIAYKHKLFLGEGDVHSLSAGHFLRLADHPRNDYNASYWVMKLNQKGWQVLPIGGTSTAGSSELGDSYKDSFIALPGTVQYRPDSQVSLKKIDVLISGVIEGDGQYAHINEHGAYKVKFHPVNKNKPDLRGSAWVRMLTPYASGMHFPLLPGTEVLIAFVNGNPDKPVITGALANSEHKNVVNDKNATQNILKTAGGNQLLMDDKSGKQAILLSSPVAESRISIGADTVTGVALASSEHIDLQSSSYKQSVQGTYTQIITGVPKKKQASPPKVLAKMLPDGKSPGTLMIGSGMTTNCYVGFFNHLVGGISTTVNVGAVSELAMGAVSQLITGAMTKVSVATDFEAVVGAKTQLYAARTEVAANVSTTFLAHTSLGVSRNYTLINYKCSSAVRFLATSGPSALELCSATGKAAMSCGLSSITLSMAPKPNITLSVLGSKICADALAVEVSAGASSVKVGVEKIDISSGQLHIAGLATTSIGSNTSPLTVSGAMVTVSGGIIKLG